MSWVCSCCSNNNEDSDLTCLICGTAKPAAPAAAETVCTLTQRRATELCSYEDVTIPSEFNVIGENAFKGRTDLYSVQIHSGVKKIMKSAFEGCTNLSRVYYSGTLSSVGARAFANCKHLSPDRRPSAERVAADAYVGCSSTPIPDPVRTVGARKTTAGTASARTGGSTSRPSFSTATEFSKSSSAAKSSTAKTGSTGSSGTRGSSSSSGTKSTSSSSGTKSTSGSSGGYRPAPTTGYRPAPTSTGYTPTRTPTYTPPSTPKRKSLFEQTRWLILIVGILVSVGLFVFCEWGRVTTWSEWSYMLGLAPALLITAASCVLFYDEDWKPAAYISTAGLVLAVLLNWWFGNACLPIVAVLTLTVAVLSTVGAYLCFEDLENGLGAWNTVLAVLSAALLVYAMIDNSNASSWQLWQVLISVALSVALALGTKYILEDGYSYEIGVGIQIVGFVITGCMLWWFGVGSALMVTLLSAAMAIAGIVSAVRCISDSDGGFGATHIIFSSLNVILLVANVLLVG